MSTLQGVVGCQRWGRQSERGATGNATDVVRRLPNRDAWAAQWEEHMRAPVWAQPALTPAQFKTVPWTRQPLPTVTALGLNPWLPP